MFYEQNRCSRIPGLIRFPVKSLQFSTAKTFRIHRKPCLSYAHCAVYFIKINNSFYEINEIRIRSTKAERLPVEKRTTVDCHQNSASALEVNRWSHRKHALSSWHSQTQRLESFHQPQKSLQNGVLGHSVRFDPEVPPHIVIEAYRKRKASPAKNSSHKEHRPRRKSRQRENTVWDGVLSNLNTNSRVPDTLRRRIFVLHNASTLRHDVLDSTRFERSLDPSQTGV
jgi:hypothetical protein